LLHLFLDVTPTFKGYTLENCKDTVEQIVEIGYTVIGILTAFSAEVSSWAILSRTEQIIRMDNTRLDGYAPIFE
jgi:hypothetical protein